MEINSAANSLKIKTYLFTSPRVWAVLIGDNIR